MSFKPISSTVYYYNSTVNIGYAHNRNTGLLVDAGIDESSVKKVLKELQKRNLPLTHLFITHAHADHYGGAAYLQKNYDIHTIAPVFEEAILRNPDLEPLYLFGGNDPVSELHNKFLMGDQVRIDEVVTEGIFQFGDIKAETFLLPGHSYHQLAIQLSGILFAADAYFDEKTLAKHKIPYVTDAELTITSLKRIKEMDMAGAVPGHGTFEEDPIPTINKNIAYHQKLLTWLFEFIKSDKNGVTHEEIVRGMCNYYSADAKNLSQWLLYRTAVTAYLIALTKEQRIEGRIENNSWRFSSL